MFNIKKIVDTATMGQSKRVRPMIYWTLLEYLLRGMPYGILLFVIWEMFNPVLYPETSLNMTNIWIATLAFALNLVLLFFVNKKAYLETYYEGYQICVEGRLAINNHLKRLPMGYYNANDPGTIGEYIVGDYFNAEMFFTHFLPQVLGAFVMPLALIVSLAFFSWQLALIAFLIIPLSFPFVWLTTKLTKYYGGKQLKTKRVAIARILEYIQGIRLVKAFNLEGKSFRRLDQSFNDLRKESINTEAGPGASYMLASFVLNCGLTLIILFGFTFLLAGTLSIPVYIMFLVLGVRVYEPLLQAYVFLSVINYMNISIERIDKLRKTPLLSEGGKTNMDGGYEVEFKNVNFAYNNIDVLRNFSVSIPSESLTALVGPSGSGKTTATRLIARFWDIQSGEIMIGGSSIKSYTTDALISAMSIVFQDVYLFSDTVYNNIKIGNPDASEEQIREAAQMASCLDFIEKMPDGFNTMVGEGGSTLSGGEKQRISIARAILKDAPIVMLDEATASLDPENEHHIQDAINHLVRNKTVIVIAHRLNTISQADKIIVIDKGSVVQEGKHDVLIEQEGLYRSMWDEQQRLKGWKFG